MLFRSGLNDAGKIADQRADADRWLEYGDRGDDLERYRELRDVAWRAAGGTLDVDGGENGGVYVTGWSKDSIRVVARIQAQAETKERAQALAKAVRIVNQGGKLSAQGPDTDNEESWGVTFDVLAPRGMNLQLEAHNGPVSVVEMNSRMDLTTVNGPMSLSGVAGDVRYRELQTSRLDLYVPHGQSTPSLNHFAIRSTLDPLPAVALVKREVSALDPYQAVSRAASMEELTSAQLARPRFNAVLLNWLAGLAMLLAALGIFGVIAYAVASARTSWVCASRWGPAPETS